MNSYLNTLRNLQRDDFTVPVVNKTMQYDNYENYLHQQSQKKSRYSQMVTQSYPQPIVTILQDEDISTQQFKNSSQIKYLPITKTIVDYELKQVKEKVPVIKKKTEYIEKKQIELVPKEVIKTDYFAVEHIRRYVKEVIPEVKVEMVSVPKTIKKTQYEPIIKQVIYYPENRNDLEAVRLETINLLNKEGLSLNPNAEFRPIKANSKLQVRNTFQYLNKNVDETKKVKFINLESVNEHQRNFSPVKHILDSNQLPFYNKSKYQSFDKFSTHAHQKKHLKLKDCNLNSQYPYEYSFADYGASKYNNINVNKLWLN